MTNASSKGYLERGAASDLWRNTLSRIPSVFGRLVYLSSLRGTNTGRYEHHGLALLFGDTETDRALRRSHLEAFAEWLGFSLEQQKADLDLYLSALGGNRKALLETWLRLMPYRNLMPATARDAEKKLYMADVETLLNLMKNEHGVVSPDPDA